VEDINIQVLKSEMMEDSSSMHVKLAMINASNALVLKNQIALSAKLASI
jgi:hypothetical protein